jgi:hypothetical protein
MANEILIDSTLVHGTAMFRRAALEGIGGWRDEAWAEDVDLWLRLLDAGQYRLAKIGEPLYSWRQHAASATRQDPRYARERMLALKCDALRRMLPQIERNATLIGVGESLRQWHRLLEGDRRIEVVEAARPVAGIYERLRPPIVLVFGSPMTRDRWREYLLAQEMVERHSFVFVA